MAQYCYYTNNDSSSANQVKKIGYNGSTYRKVGYSGTVFYLESYWSMKYTSNGSYLKYTYEHYTEGKSTPPLANHTWTVYSVSLTEVYDGVTRHAGYYTTQSLWETSFILWDTNNNFTTQSASSIILQDYTYANGSYRKTYDEGRLKSTVVLKAFYNGNGAYQTGSTYTYSNLTFSGQAQKTLSKAWQQTSKPNNGILQPIKNFVTDFDDVVSAKSTTRYKPEENYMGYSWGTW